MTPFKIQSKKSFTYKDRIVDGYRGESPPIQYLRSVKPMRKSMFKIDDFYNATNNKEIASVKE